jgi:hypothetical protein
MYSLKFLTTSNNEIEDHKIKLTKKEYDDLVSARQILTRILSHEELYDQVIESFIEAKSVMYEFSLRSLSDNINGDYINYHNYRSRLNRLYFNTLNLSKLYLDKHYFENKNNVTCYVNRVTGDSEENIKIIKTQREEYYNSDRNYRLGCSLRNYVQHDSLPVNATTRGVRHDSISDKSFAVFHIPLDKQKLKRGGVKANVLRMFEDKIDLHEVMDGYIHALSAMHMTSRSLVAHSMENALRTFEVYAVRAREVGIPRFGVQVLENDIKRFHLEVEWFAVAKHLQRKNAREVNFKNFTPEPYNNF